MPVDAGVSSIDERQSEERGTGLPRPPVQKQKQPLQQQQEEGETLNDAKADDRQSQQRQQMPSSLTLPAVGSRSVCRICHTDSWAKEPLISPCRCKGTLAHVHLSCLERWLNQSCRNYCELCNFRYNALETQRYGCVEALRIWTNHPRNRRHIRADALIFMLLTIFTAGLTSVCLLGRRYFLIEGARVGFSETSTIGAITLFMAIVILGYSASVYLLIRNKYNREILCIYTKHCFFDVEFKKQA